MFFILKICIKRLLFDQKYLNFTRAYSNIAAPAPFGRTS